MDTAVDKMELWNQVCVSKPDTVKKMTHGAKLNAIDAHSQLQRATELWGPYGDLWGLRNMSWGYVGDPKSGIPCTLTLDAVFFYPAKLPYANGEIRLVQFEVSSDIAFKPAGECRKKLMTDVTTKALSKLGFNADVFLNKFSDNRYVDELRRAENVVSIEEYKNKKTANFMAAVSGLTGNTELIMRVLGVHGFESLDEIQTTEDRKAFVNALRQEVAKG